MKSKPFVYQFGKIHPFGVPLSHSWAAVGAILMAIQEYKIGMFVELGVEHGGLMSILVVRSLLSDSKFMYMGIDKELVVNPGVIKLSRSSPLSQFYLGDVFSENIISSVNILLGIANSPAMIYCDNGDKAKELRTYAPLLSPGDLIGAHDLDHEYTFDDIKDIPDLERIEVEWLEDTRIVLFRKV